MNLGLLRTKAHLHLSQPRADDDETARNIFWFHMTYFGALLDPPPLLDPFDTSAAVYSRQTTGIESRQNRLTPAKGVADQVLGQEGRGQRPRYFL